MRFLVYLHCKLKAPKKKTGKGHHSWPVLESVTEEKDEKGNPKLAYCYPSLKDTDNWKDIMLISVLGEKAPCKILDKSVMLGRTWWNF
jgi:hypothetical protein